MAALSEKALELLRGKNFAYVATVNRDGAPQVTPVWIDTDGTNVLFNTAEGRLKTDNLRRDGRVSIAISDPNNAYQYVSIKGRVKEMRTEGAKEHIDALAQKYLNQTPYPFYRGETRVTVVVEPEKLGGMG